MMLFDDHNQALMEDMSRIRDGMRELETTLSRLDRVLNQQSKSVADLIARIAAAASAIGSLSNVSVGGSGARLSQSQMLAEIALAIARANRRNM